MEKLCKNGPLLMKMVMVYENSDCPIRNLFVPEAECEDLSLQGEEHANVASLGRFPSLFRPAKLRAIITSRNGCKSCRIVGEENVWNFLHGLV